MQKLLISLVLTLLAIFPFSWLSMFLWNTAAVELFGSQAIRLNWVSALSSLGLIKLIHWWIEFKVTYTDAK